MTTSFTVDILESDKKQSEKQLGKKRRKVHIMMAVIMGVIILAFYYANNDSAIKLVYALASYTYGPILGLFAYGMFTKCAVRDKWVPLVCVLSPVLSWVLQDVAAAYWNYEIGFELLLYNAAFTVIGLWGLKVSK